MMNSELEERVFYWINAVRQSDRRTESTCTCLREGAHLLSIHSIGAADFGLYMCVCAYRFLYRREASGFVLGKISERSDIGLNL